MSLQAKQDIAVVAMEADDWTAVRVVYLEGIASDDSTFEKSAPEWEKWDRDHLRACRLGAMSR